MNANDDRPERQRHAIGNGNGNGNGQAPNGSVLVCGGGVAGIQAALDLSAAGFAVYLVEESPTIGGTMARLDKTFPTGDCATCIISPKLVQCMRDYNIEVLTMADVQSLEGEAGAFKVEVQRRPRGVIAEKCTGCGDCWSQCPVRYVPQPTAAMQPSEHLTAPRCGLGRCDPGPLSRRPGPADPGPSGRDRRAPLSAPPGAGVPGRAAEDFAGRDPPRGQFLQRLQPGAGGAAHDRDLPGHGLLRPRLGAALGTPRAGNRRRRGRNRFRGQFTLRTVRCIGCCALAPAMRIDGVTFGKVKLDKVVNILEQFA